MLDRLRADFEGLRIFFNDPVLPADGHEGRNWRDDFQLILHIQDDVRTVRETGNIFLTNIHRVFLGDVADPSLEDDDLRDHFLDPFGPKPVGRTTDSKADLGEIILLASARSCWRTHSRGLLRLAPGSLTRLPGLPARANRHVNMGAECRRDTHECSQLDVLRLRRLQLRDR